MIVVFTREVPNNSKNQGIRLSTILHQQSIVLERSLLDINISHRLDALRIWGLIRL